MPIRSAALPGIVVLLAVTACGSNQTPRSVVRSHDCFIAWNAQGNERNRADLARRGFSFTIGSVARSFTVGDPAPGGTRHEGHGCGYLFHSTTRFVSYTGDWHGDTLIWTNAQGMHGRWTAAQQRTQPDDVRVLADGRIAKR
jgi:hypothetical protein